MPSKAAEPCGYFWIVAWLDGSNFTKHFANTQLLVTVEQRSYLDRLTRSGNHEGV